MRAIAASLSGLLAAGTVAASTLGVAPIRIELSPTVSTAVLTVRNQEDAPVVVQARPAAWSQHEEQDQLDDTRDLLVTPPLFTLPPKGQQVLRIALLRKPDPSRELDYRLVLSEVPSAVAAQVTGLRVALRITLPVFVAAQTHTSPDLTWHHSWLPDGTLQIEAHNHGTAHVQILDFDVLSEDQREKILHTDNGRYLLPGTIAHWQLRAGASVGSPAPHIVLHGHSDAADFTVTSGPGAQ
jgi:fimbrial chaperone protein